ncbi:MAG: hypothetical protein NTW16_13600 [Bacteroidetes bacterium]|nr:hypothetical protein [Bacteroidota bacterium]
MKKLIFILVLHAFLLNSSAVSFGQNAQQHTLKVQRAVIQEVLQTSNYSYLRVKADKSVQWIAVPAGNFRVGDTCYYKGGLSMPDFKSKELKKTFDKVLFLEGVSTSPEKANSQPVGMPEHGKKTQPVKSEDKIEPASGGITIAELYKNKDKYNGKVVIIRGKVVKFTPKIMGKNWVHLQDGTSFGDKYDVPATLKTTLKVGDIVTIESKVTLNKDYGSGYFFEVILEDVTLK